MNKDPINDWPVHDNRYASKSQLLDISILLGGKQDAETIFVDSTSGTDDRTGLSKFDKNNPFESIAAAADAANGEADTVIVRALAGTYNESSTVNLYRELQVEDNATVNFTAAIGIQVKSELAKISGLGVFTVNCSNVALSVDNSLSFDFQWQGKSCSALAGHAKFIHPNSTHDDMGLICMFTETSTFTSVSDDQFNFRYGRKFIWDGNLNRTGTANGTHNWAWDTGFQTHLQEYKLRGTFTVDDVLVGSLSSFTSVLSPPTTPAFKVDIQDCVFNNTNQGLGVIQTMIAGSRIANNIINIEYATGANNVNIFSNLEGACVVEGNIINATDNSAGANPRAINVDSVAETEGLTFRGNIINWPFTDEEPIEMGYSPAGEETISFLNNVVNLPSGYSLDAAIQETGDNDTITLKVSNGNVVNEAGGAIIPFKNTTITTPGDSLDIPDFFAEQQARNDLRYSKLDNPLAVAGGLGNYASSEGGDVVSITLDAAALEDDYEYDYALNHDGKRFLVDFILLEAHVDGSITTAPVIDFIGDNDSITLTGTADPQASTSLNGSGTLFKTEVAVGDEITINGETRTIISNPGNTLLIVDEPFTDTPSSTISREALSSPLVQSLPVGGMQGSFDQVFLKSEKQVLSISRSLNRFKLDVATAAVLGTASNFTIRIQIVGKKVF